MDSWGNLVVQPKPSALEQAQQLSTIKYTAPLQSPPTRERNVTILESRGLILSGGTTGNRTWEAALHLGSFLASPAGEALVHGKRVIELGAGTGFLSLFCARHLGVRGVVATDREPFLIENMRACARLNQTGGDIPFYPAVWDWGTRLEQTDEMSSMTESRALEFDVALGADLVRSPNSPISSPTTRACINNPRSTTQTSSPSSSQRCTTSSQITGLVSSLSLRRCGMRIRSGLF